MYQQGLINKKLFGIYINRTEDFETDGNGVITLGDYNLTYAPKDYTLGWNTVVNTNYWSV